MQLTLLSLLAALSTSAFVVASTHDDFTSALTSLDKRDFSNRRLDTRATVKCKTGTHFLKSGKCVACTTLNSDALKCSTAGKITACKTKLFYSGRCITAASCPSGTYPNTSKKTCATCTSLFTGSSKCTAQAATTCKSGYYLNSGKCVKTCPTGMYGSSGKCSSCASKFTGSSTCTVYKVTKCASSYYLSGTKCVKTCPSGYYGSSGKCSTCTSKFTGSKLCTVWKPTSCASSYFLSASKCLKTCPTGTYANTNDHTCTTCATDFGAGAKTCTAKSGALVCADGYVKYINSQGGACALDCGSNTSYGDTKTDTCKLCTEEDKGAATCSPGTGLPTSCQEGYTLTTTSTTSSCKAN